MNAVIGSILENLKAIEIIYEPTVEVFKGDRTNTGDSKEISVNDFILSYLTSAYRVKKGKIYSLDNESANIDCVVLSPNHPNLITPKREIILAEGVFCAIEVKPDITSLTEKSEFSRGLKQIQSIKKLNRQITKISGRGKPKSFDSIPSVIFSKYSSDFDKVVGTIREKVLDKQLKPDELPDLIFSMDKGALFYCPSFKDHRFFKLLSDSQKLVFNEAVFLHFSSNEKHVNLLLFLIIVLNFQKPDIPISDFFIKKYLTLENMNETRQLYLLDESKMDLEKNPELEKKLIELANKKK